MRERSTPLLVLCLAVVAVAHGSIFVRLAAAPPLAIAAWRLTLASLIVLPLALFRQGGAGLLVGRRSAGLILAAGILLAAHFATWISSLAYTSISNSVVLVSTAPVWVAIIGLVTRTLRLTQRMWLAIVISMLGSIVIGWGSASVGAGSLRGDLLALTGGVCMGAYLLIAQRAQRALDFLPYVALTYSTAAVVLWVAALAAGVQVSGFTPATWWALAGIAVVSQVIGHSGYNWSLRHLRPDFVAITLLGEPVLASLLGLALFGERIPPATIAGGTLVLFAITLAARAQLAESARASGTSATGDSREAA